MALRLLGVTEGSGRFLSREGSNLWVKTADGRVGLPVNPDIPLARRVGSSYHPTTALTLRPGDKLRWYRTGTQVLALWVEMEADGPEYERDSAWTEWVRRVPARELARRMAGRVAGTEVREVTVTRRSPTGRAIEMRVKTDLAEATFKRFDLRQAVEMPEMLFTVSKVGGCRRAGGVRVPRPRLGPRRRHVSKRRLRHGAGRPDLRPDPAPLLHQHRHRPRLDRLRPGRALLTLSATAGG